MKTLCSWVVAGIFVFCVFGIAVAEQQDPLIKDLEEIVALGEGAPDAKIKAIRNKIESSPEEALTSLLKRAKTPGLQEKDMAICIWAMGLTRSPKAVDDIIRLSSGSKSKAVLFNAYHGLANIGGKRSEEYLFEKLKDTPDPMERFDLFNLLARLKYKPAIPGTIEILKKEPAGYYWQAMFVFGKYGDLAVPFLLGKINDKDKNIRTNSIMVLGKWLIAQEAAEPMRKQFREEGDPDIRGLILSSLEMISSSLQEVKAFSQEVLKKEKDEKVTKFAKETIDGYTEMEDLVNLFKSKKKNDRALFRSEYQKIYSSYGKEGNYDELSFASTRADEQELKRLKEKILQRDSDECFLDYKKINMAIMLNRFMGP